MDAFLPAILGDSCSKHRIGRFGFWSASPHFSWGPLDGKGVPPDSSAPGIPRLDKTCGFRLIICDGLPLGCGAVTDYADLDQWKPIHRRCPEFANGLTTEPLVFKLRNITQIVYLVYGVLLAILVSYKNSELQELVRSIRIFLIFAIFVSIWGFLQFFCSLLNITYPAYIFNTSATGSALGYLETLDDIGITRVSSVAVEPSIFAACMLIALVFALFAVVRNQPLISKWWDRFAVAIIFGALVISTSTIAYLGLLVVFVIYLCSLVYMRILRGRQVIVLLLLAGFLVLAIALFSPAQDMIYSLIVGKGESYSGIGRAYSVALAAQYFLQYPVLGLGWGSVTSHDLIFKLLSNTGILGFSVFSYFMISLLRRLWRGSKTVGISNPEWRWWSRCLLAACLVMVFTNITTGFDFVFEHFWFLLGLAMSVPSLNSALSLKHPPPELHGQEAVAT